jgi:aminopeptidase
MPDPRIAKLAQVLVHYSLGLRPGQEVCLVTTPLAEELNLAVYQEALSAGAYVSVLANLPGLDEIFFNHAGEAQLDHISPLRRMVVEQFAARLTIMAPHNSRELAHLPPERIGRARRAGANSSRPSGNALPAAHLGGATPSILRPPWRRKRI